MQFWRFQTPTRYFTVYIHHLWEVFWRRLVDQKIHRSGHRPPLGSYKKEFRKASPKPLPNHFSKALFCLSRVTNFHPWAHELVKYDTDMSPSDVHQPHISWFLKKGEYLPDFLSKVIRKSLLFVRAYVAARRKKGRLYSIARYREIKIRLKKGEMG